MKPAHVLKSLFLALALIAGVALSPARALADKLHLKDGRVLDGTLVKEGDGFVYFKVKVGGLENTEFYTSDQFTSIDRDDAAKPAAEETKAAAATDKPAAATPAKSGAPKIAVITLGEGGEKDMVGLFITAKTLHDAIPLLEQEGVTDVVFRIRSGGGALSEIQKLSDVIQNEYKPKFRVVAWIQSAISAAAMTSHCIEDIYMMKEGNYGACTGWSGALVAVKGRQLEEILYMMEKISARGKHPKEIMRSMQIMEPLSCTIDADGEVHWYQNLDGDYVVNPKERILCFNAEDAVKYKFAKGIADDIDTLAHEMGYNEYTFVGKQVPGVAYPVCRAEEEQRKFRDLTEDAQKKTAALATEYTGALQLAQSSPREDRGKFVNKCNQVLDQIERMVKQNPNLAEFIFGRTPEQFKEWVRQQRDLLRELMKK
jgi:hypothetical protein